MIVAAPRLPNICCPSARKWPQLQLVGIACFSGQLPLATPRQSPTLRLNYANCRCCCRCSGGAMTLKRQHGNCVSRWLVSVAAFAAPPHHFSAAPAPAPAPVRPSSLKMLQLFDVRCCRRSCCCSCSRCCCCCFSLLSGNVCPGQLCLQWKKRFDFYTFFCFQEIVFECIFFYQCF